MNDLQYMCICWLFAVICTALLVTLLVFTILISKDDKQNDRVHELLFAYSFLTGIAVILAVSATLTLTLYCIKGTIDAIYEDAVSRITADMKTNNVAVAVDTSVDTSS